MKTILFILLAFQLSAQNYYCVQVISTRNPHLLKPEMVSILPDTAKVEQSGEWFRILFVYASQEEANIYHTSWLKQHSNAFICVRTKEQVERMTDLFSKD
jgi:hypothetical protein